MDFEYTTATDLDRAWLNFELDLPLERIPMGSLSVAHLQTCSLAHLQPYTYET